MTFHEITAEDGRWAIPLLQENRYKSCEFAFVNVYMWSRVYHSVIAHYQDFVIARSEGQRLHYLYPAGHGDHKAALDAILEDAALVGKAPVIFSIPEAEKQEMEALYPGRFVYTMPREESDYIYLASDLADLPGKKYQKKRNHCSRFERDYPSWAFHKITEESMSEIRAFNNRWCNLYDNRGDEGIEEEHRAIDLVFSHYDELCIRGGYLTVDGEIVAFSFGSKIYDDMFCTHVEKALYDVNGAYSMINREMARHFCSDVTYINRENDVGEDGLREAKLSYHPVEIEDKYVAELG